ncbi:alpha/beta fold hydrolase [Actinoplanes sp. NPDC051343]|uniref:alpha/beta fold hydrolase n=1 Tax=Actinoplanes sp. NPDC051343 TaxID=3363906 RepID=UPI0037B50F09
MENLIVEGSGRSILVLHGGMGDLSSWEKVTDRLRDRFRVARLYRRQYRLDVPRKVTMADEVAEVLAAASTLDRPVLVGHSSGAVLALEALAASPETFSAAVLYEPPLIIDDRRLGDGTQTAQPQPAQPQTTQPQTAQPQPSQNAQPQPSQTAQPQPSQTTQPQPSQTAQPQLSEPTQPRSGDGRFEGNAQPENGRAAQPDTPRPDTRQPGGGSAGRPIERARAALAEGRPGTAFAIFLAEVAGIGGVDGVEVAAIEATVNRKPEIAPIVERQLDDNDAIDALGNRLAAYSKIGLPVLLLTGDQSPLHLQERLGALQAVLPDARRVTLPGEGHNAERSAPDRLAEIIGEFAEI